MGSIVFQEKKIYPGKKAKPTKLGFIKDVVFGFARLQTPHLKYQSEDEYQYSVDVFVQPETVEDFETEFDSYGANTPVKWVPVQWLEDIYGIDPEEMDFDTEEQKPSKFKSGTTAEEKKKLKRKKFECFAIITFSCNATVGEALAKGSKGRLKPGDDIPYSYATRPKAYIYQGKGKPNRAITYDPKKVDPEDLVDDEDIQEFYERYPLIGNGSSGTVAFRVAVSKNGEFPYLYQILVKDLVEYEPEGSGESDDCAFGDCEEDDFSTSGESAFDDDDDEEEEEAPRRRRGSNSTKRRRSVLDEEPEEEEDEPEEEEKPKRKSRKRTTKKVEKEPESEKGFGFKVNEEDDDDDDFEGFDDDEPEEEKKPKTQRRKRTTKKPEPEPEVDEDDDDDDDVPY